MYKSWLAACFFCQLGQRHNLNFRFNSWIRAMPRMTKRIYETTILEMKSLGNARELNHLMKF